MLNKFIFVVIYFRVCLMVFECVFMIRYDIFYCVYELFGDVFYYGFECLSECFEDDEEGCKKSGFF